MTEEEKFKRYLRMLNEENSIDKKEEAMLGLLGLYYKQQTEIEEWQKAYIRENNYWLKFRNKINKIANNNKDCSDNEVIKAVKNLKEKNASLQKEIKLMKSININDNYISKDKIKQKIKELERKGFENEINYSEFYYKTEVLKELLEENNKCK